MSTYRTPFNFFGRYFSSREAAQAYLEKHGTDYDNDSVHDETSPKDLGLEYLTESNFALGFYLRPGQSDAEAKALWAARFHGDMADADSHVDIATY